MQHTVKHKNTHNHWFKVWYFCCASFLNDVLSVYCPSFQSRQLYHLGILPDSWSCYHVHSTLIAAQPVNNLEIWSCVIKINSKKKLFCLLFSTKQYRVTLKDKFLDMPHSVFIVPMIMGGPSYINRKWIKLNSSPSVYPKHSWCSHGSQQTIASLKKKDV